MSATLLKLGLLAAMVILTMIAGLTPIWVLKVLRKQAATAQTSRKQQYVSLMLCLLTCFSGGVFLATCFLHLFPELTEHLVHMRLEHGFDFDYPLAELLSCMGFFLLFFLEEAVLYLVPSMAHGHSHGGHGHGHSHGDDDFFDTIPKKNGHGAESHQTTCLNRQEDVTDASLKLLSNADELARDTNLKLVGATISSENSSSHLKSATETNSARNVAHFNKGTSCDRSVCTTTFLNLEFAEPERCEVNCEKVKEDPPIRMKSRPHAHSHGTRSFTIVLAISFHAIIEGMALGVQNDPPKIWAIFISLTVHKLIVAFSVGLQLARTHAHNLHWVIISMVLISLMTPLGGIFGMLVQTAPLEAYARDIIILICQGVAVGTFIYVTFFEVLIHERDNEHPNLLKLVVMIAGFAFIGLLRLLAEGHSHSHSHSGHSHGDGKC